MATNEKTSKSIAELASRAMSDPKSLTQAEIRRLGASALTQAADKPPAKKATAKKAPATKKRR